MDEIALRKICYPLIIISFFVVSCNKPSESTTDSSSIRLTPETSVVLPLSPTLSQVTLTPTLPLPTPTELRKPVSQLPNIVLGVSGNVFVIRSKSTSRIQIGFGTELSLNDNLKLEQGSRITIFCGDQSQWDENPITLSYDSEDERGGPCLAEGQYRPVNGLSHPRNPTISTIIEAPYVISPRTGFLLSSRPTFKWHMLNSTDIYTVTLLIPGQKSYPSIITIGDMLEFPTEWSDLKASGQVYGLQIQTGDLNSNDEEVDGLGFSLLEERQIADLQNKISHSLKNIETEPARSFLLAHLYMLYRLRSETIELLLGLETTSRNNDEIIAIRKFLGDTYLEMKLPNEAEQSYIKALKLLENIKFPEIEAEIYFKLSLINCVAYKDVVAREHWSHAKHLYESLDLDALYSDQLDLLQNINVSCANK